MSANSLRSRARILMWLVTIPFAGLSIVTAVLVGNIIWQGGKYADSVVIYYFPMFLYTWAIWMVRHALKAIAEGALFDQVVPKLLFRVGVALFAGALFTVVGQPLLWPLLHGVPLSRTFEPSPVTLGVIGAALILFSNLLQRAASLREELDEFF